MPPSLTPNSPATSGPQGPLRLQGSAWMTQKSWQNAKNVRYTTASSTTGWTSQKSLIMSQTQHQMKVKLINFQKYNIH